MPRPCPLKLARITLERIELRLRAPLERSGGAIATRDGIRVEIFDVSGERGCGEALPLVSAGTETLEETSAAMLEARSLLESRSDTLESMLDALEERLERWPAARCAFDVALHDLDARLRRAPVARCLSPDARRALEVNALIGADDTAACLRECRQAWQRGYRTLKLKVGRGSPAEDGSRIAAVREALGPEARLRIDANGAWTAECAVRALERMAELDIELVEQPTRADDLDALAWVHARSPIPIAADEALAGAEGRARLLCDELANIAIIKPMVLGGLRAAAQLCIQASARGIDCIVTTTLDGPTMTAAALHLAAAHGSCNLAHGLAACEQLETDFPTWLVPSDGRLAVGEEPGLGFAQ